MSQHKYTHNKIIYIEQSENKSLWLVRERTSNGDFILQVCITKKEAEKYKEYYND